MVGITPTTYLNWNQNRIKKQNNTMKRLSLIRDINHFATTSSRNCIKQSAIVTGISITSVGHFHQSSTPNIK